MLVVRETMRIFVWCAGCLCPPATQSTCEGTFLAQIDRNRKHRQRKRDGEILQWKIEMQLKMKWLNLIKAQGFITLDSPHVCRLIEGNIRKMH